MASDSVHGKIFSKDEADKLYGPVLFSVKFSFSDFKNIIAKTKSNVMFRFEGEELYIFDNKRNIIYPETPNRSFQSSDVLKNYSMSVVDELVSGAESAGVTDGDDAVVVEQRKEVVSVSTKVQTMEVAVDCPPICS